MPLTDPWADFRRRMPVAHRWAYFDHAAVAPLSAPARDAITAWTAEAAAEGDAVYPRWRHRVEEVRRSAAKLLGADAAEIALLHSTTAGINVVAEGFPWRAGDNIVTLANEFPSNLYPWMNQAWQGVEVRRVAPAGARIDLDALAAACDERTRIVSVSWVGYASGWRLDLAAAAEIAHTRGALLFVDAIQGLGVFPLDVSAIPIDFLAGDGHKWLLGPEGAAVFFVRRRHLDLLRPTGVGWHSVANPADFSHIELNFRSSAARYEGGSPNIVGFMGFGASLDLLMEIGAERLATRILEITDLACEQLRSAGATIESDRDGDHRSGIVLFDLPGKDPVSVRERCLEHGVVLSCRAGRLRISPHAYATSEDIERLMVAIGE